jgi:hypothetical protein
MNRYNLFVGKISLKAPNKTSVFYSYSKLKTNFVIAFSLIGAMSSALVSATTPPPDDLNSIFKPFFATAERDIPAGTAFVVEHANSYYAVTSHSIFSRQYGFSDSLTPQELRNNVKGVKLNSLHQRGKDFEAGQSVAFADAQPLNNKTSKHDIAAFELTETPEDYLRVSRVQPEVGDVVWLYARVTNKDPKQLLHPAIVKKFNGNFLIVEFEDAKMVLNGTSGAPIINEFSEVIGIALVGGKHQGKYKIYANPMTAIQVAFDTYIDSEKQVSLNE